MLHFKSQQLHCESVTPHPSPKGQFDKIVSNRPEYKTYPFQWRHWEVQPILHNSTTRCHCLFFSYGTFTVHGLLNLFDYKKGRGFSGGPFLVLRNLEIPTSFPHFMLQNTSTWYILLLSAQKIISQVSGCSKENKRDFVIALIYWLARSVQDLNVII